MVGNLFSPVPKSQDDLVKEIAESLVDSVLSELTSTQLETMAHYLVTGNSASLDVSIEVEKYLLQKDTTGSVVAVRAEYYPHVVKWMAEKKLKAKPSVQPPVYRAPTWHAAETEPDS